MKSLFGWLAIGLTLVVIISFVRLHRPRVPLAASAPFAEPAQVSARPYSEEQEAQKMVTVNGPLANYMARQEQPQVEILQAVAYKPAVADHVGGSMVGSSMPLLHQTFKVRNAVDLPFEIPAHAATPRLRGGYRSFFRQSGKETGDAGEDVEFLVLSEQQYSAFLKGRSGETTFSAEDAHAQEIDTTLPPTLDQPAKYHLVFRNNSKKIGMKLVRADLGIDF